DESLGIFLISLKAGGTGLNLTSADYVFLADPWWNPAVERQAIDRAHRIGQTQKVFSYKFITKNSVEEKILSLQKRKMELAENLIDTDDYILRNIDLVELEELLE
ncbi:MAG: helicase-related protein, partial [Bacteroidia bacterium]